MLGIECYPYHATIIHKRKHPKKHEFRYHSLQFSVEAGQLDKVQGNVFFAINKKALISINRKDYGNGRDTRKWLRKCLLSNGFKRHIEKIYLSTFPKVLGIGFNPVSFWYCFDKNQQLMAVIAEVNNTFSERKIYLISKGDEPMVNGESFELPKDFYVSPYIEVSGLYSFRFYRNTDAAVQIARIELKQGQDTLITTSISGEKINMDSISGLKLFISVLFLPVITLIRINVQAAKLWLKGIKLVKKE